MSYCRWSDEAFACDLYVYESDRGYEVRVATHRREMDRSDLLGPLPPRDSDEWIHAYVGRHKQIMDRVKDAPLKKIGLPYDGEDYLLATPGEAADKLEELRAAGYNVPQYAIDALREEARGEGDVS